MRDVGHVLICRVGERLCALPLGAVIETMRPQPIERIDGAPPAVRGLAVVRGVPTPVIDAARVLGHESSRATRLVTIHAGERAVALLVDEVVCVRRIDEIADLPPVFDPSNVVAGVGTLDDELLLVLQSARLVSNDMLEPLR